MDNLTHLVCVNNITTYAKGFVPMSTGNNMGCCSLTNFPINFNLLSCGNRSFIIHENSG